MVGLFGSKRQQQGFTLIELLVVIAIISVLAGLLLTNFVGARSRAADAKKKNDLRQLKTALRLYYNDYQRYPAASGPSIAGCGINGTGSCTGGGVFSAGAGPTVYMNQLPTGFNYFAPAGGGNAFLIRMQLENASDADIAASVARCNPTSRSYYSGTPGALDYFVCED